MVEQAHEERTQKERSKSEAQAILSYSHAINSGMVEKQLRKLGGIKEIMTNPVSYRVRIRYDPRVLTTETVRSLLKKLVQDRER